MDERDEKIDKLSTENLMLHEELAQARATMQAMADELEDSVTLMKAAVEALENENRVLRRIWCMAYAGVKGYYDDGEASDSSAHPSIDFLRDPVATILKNIHARKEAAAGRSRELTDAELERVLHFAAQWGTVQHVARSDVKGYRTQVVFDVPLRAYLFAKNLVGVL